jgi:hypothetical protein
VGAMSSKWPITSQQVANTRQESRIAHIPIVIEPSAGNASNRLEGSSALEEGSALKENGT